MAHAALEWSSCTTVVQRKQRLDRMEADLQKAFQNMDGDKACKVHVQLCLVQSILGFLFVSCFPQ